MFTPSRPISWSFFSNNILSVKGDEITSFDSLPALIEGGFIVDSEDLRALKDLFGPGIVTHDFIVLRNDMEIAVGSKTCVKGVTPVLIFDPQRRLVLIGSLSFV